MIRVESGDRDALIAFMSANAPFLMFPLTNMIRYGLGGKHPRAMKAWVAKNGAEITDVLTISAEGIVFPWCPSGDWVAVADVLKGRQVKGFIGEKEQVTALRRVTGLSRQAALDVVEPSFALTIADLTMPSIDGFSLYPLTAAPLDLLVHWRANYQVETLATPVDQAQSKAAREIKAYIQANSHRVLVHDETPVAMTGFNAQMPDIVQIGGVYTPPEWRSRGFARVALAMHLMETSLDGVTKAVLSAANDAAARAYAALGFERTGSFAVALYEETQVAHG